MTKNKDGNNAKQRDPDMVNAEIAMQRAAIKAREITIQTRTAIVTSNNNVIKEEYPEESSTRD